MSLILREILFTLLIWKEYFTTRTLGDGVTLSIGACQSGGEIVITKVCAVLGTRSTGWQIKNATHAKSTRKIKRYFIGNVYVDAVSLK